MLVPLVRNPEVQYQSGMDQEMSKIISSKMKTDEKVKMYNDILSNYMSTNQEVKEREPIPGAPEKKEDTPKAVLSAIAKKNLINRNKKMDLIIKQKGRKIKQLREKLRQNQYQTKKKQDIELEDEGDDYFDFEEEEEEAVAEPKKKEKVKKITFLDEKPLNEKRQSKQTNRYAPGQTGLGWIFNRNYF